MSLVRPRQSGKTTLARELLPEDSVNYFDLEDPVSLARLEEPRTALEPLSGLVVIDEVQRRPDLFPILRVLADRRTRSARFLILGSASGDLLRQSSESLAGRMERMERIEIGGFTLAELGPQAAPKLWRRGGFPLAWRKQFIQTLLERDLPQWGVRDSGLLHQLLGLDSEKALRSHPKLDASWEGFVIEQVLASEPHDEAWFWATHQGAEIDLMLRRGDRLLGVECKRADAPKLTPSIRTALSDLGLERVAVVYPGARRYPLGEQVEVVPLETLAEPGGLFARRG